MAYAKKITGAKSAKPAFKWTEGEMEQIARDSLKYLADDAHLSRIDAVRKAVEQLPASRRKFIVDMAHSKWILPYWDKIAAQKDALNAAHGLFEGPSPEAVSELVANPSEAAETPETAALSPAQARMQKARETLRERIADGSLKLIRWNQGEQRLIAKEFVRLRDAATPEAREKALFEIQTVRRAMENALPNARKREIKTLALIREWFAPTVAAVEGEVAAEREEQMRLEREAADAEMRERAEREAAEFAAKEAADKLHEEHRAEAERVAREVGEALQAAEARERTARYEAVDSFKRNATIDDLLGLVARRLVRAIVPAFVDELRIEMRAAMSGVVDEGKAAISSAVASVPGFIPGNDRTYIPKPKTPERVRLPNVLVYGLSNPNIENEVAREYGDRLELSFVHPDQASQGARKAANADVSVICKDYVPHNGTASIKAASREFALVSGGATSVKRWLAEYLERRVGGAQTAH